MPADLAENMAAQARALFGNLPGGLISEDEPLHFRTDNAGGLWVLVDATGDLFTSSENRTIRIRGINGESGTTITVWQAGQLVEFLTCDLEIGGMKLWQPTHARN